MSRQNKVNPGMYTQRGRLAQDDAAREIAKQRSVASENTWQPTQRDAEPRLPSDSEGDEDDTSIAAPDESAEKTPARVTAKPKSAPQTAARKAAKGPAKKTARAKRAKKTSAPAVPAKAKRGRTTKAKAKSAKRRKS